jgi:four helix bundle protein
VSDFRELKVWQKAHELTLDVYRVTAQFPKQEIYGLVSQMRRCAASVGSNIAEGKGRRGDIGSDASFRLLVVR